jgi:hypothetical protein
MKIDIELTDDEALAFAQFLKRVGIGNYKPLAEFEEEAWKMMSAGEAIRNALADAGISPR